MGARVHRTALIFSAILLATGCDDEGGDDMGSTASFKELQEEIFTNKCTLASCHSVDFHAGELILEDGVAYDELFGDVDNQAAIDEGIEQVVPGDPDASFLLMKVQGGLDPKYGAVMPQGSSEGLPEDDVALIRRWIEDGAPNG